MTNPSSVRKTGSVTRSAGAPATGRSAPRRPAKIIVADQLQVDEAANEQPRPGQQHQGQGHLGHDQQSGQTAPSPAGRGPRRREVDGRASSRRAQRRDEADHERRRERQRDDDKERARADHRPADVLIIESRHPERHGPHRGHREAGAEHPGRRAQNQGLDDEVAPDPYRGCTERLPHRRLPRAVRGAHEHQVAGVGARDQKHEGHGAEEQGQRRADAPVAPDSRPHVRLERIQRFRDQGVLVAQRALLVQAAADGGQLGGDPLLRHVSSASGEGVQLLPARHRRLGIPIEWRPRLRVGPGKTERGRHDADHAVGAPVDAHRSVRRRPITGADLSPEVFPQHSRIGPVSGSQVSAVDRRDTQRRQQPGRDTGHPHRSRGGSVGDDNVGHVAFDGFEARRGLSQRLEGVEGQEGSAAAAAHAPHFEQPLAGGERERTQQHAVDHAPGRGGRADAERHREDGEQCESRRSRETPDRVSKITKHVAHGSRGNRHDPPRASVAQRSARRRRHCPGGRLISMVAVSHWSAAGSSHDAGPEGPAVR